MLAGFVAKLYNDDIGNALATAVKVATARAWGLTEEMNWTQAQREIETEVNSL